MGLPTQGFPLPGKGLLHPRQYLFPSTPLRHCLRWHMCDPAPLIACTLGFGGCILSKEKCWARSGSAERFPMLIRDLTSSPDSCFCSSRLRESLKVIYWSEMNRDYHLFVRLSPFAISVLDRITAMLPKHYDQPHWSYQTLGIVSTQILKFLNCQQHLDSIHALRGQFLGWARSSNAKRQSGLNGGGSS